MKKRILFTVCCFVLLSCGGKKEKSEAKEKTEITKKQQSPLAKSMERGKQVYTDMCVTCHLPNGKGVPKVYPPLAKSDYLIEKQLESIKAIKYGMQGEVVVNGVTYNQVMSPLGLDDDEIADVMNYISNSWGNEAKSMITQEQVAKINK